MHSLLRPHCLRRTPSSPLLAASPSCSASISSSAPRSVAARENRRPENVAPPPIPRRKDPVGMLKPSSKEADHPLYPRTPVPPPIHSTTVKIVDLDRNLPKEELEATLRAQGYKFRALAFAEPESTLPFMTENYFNKEKAEPQAATTKIAYVATESELDANRLLASREWTVQTESSAWGRRANPHSLWLTEQPAADQYYDEQAKDPFTQPTEALRLARQYQTIVDFGARHRLRSEIVQLRAFPEGRELLLRQERERLEAELREWEEREERRIEGERFIADGRVEDWRRMETEREKKERSEEAERKIREEELREEKIRAKAASILKKLRGDQVPAEEDAMIIRSEYSALLERLKPDTLSKP